MRHTTYDERMLRHHCGLCFEDMYQGILYLPERAVAGDAMPAVVAAGAARIYLRYLVEEIA